MPGPFTIIHGDAFLRLSASHGQAPRSGLPLIGAGIYARHFLLVMTI